MADFSPAAQAVLHEFWQAPVSPSRNVQIAAALRAAADLVVPKEKTGGKMFAWQHERLAQRLITRDCILTIAAELEGANV